MTDPTPTARLSAALDGRYRIERKIGEGGMASVYLAEDLKHERQVALKILRPELAAVIGAERFLAEIKTTANLQHPHVLPLFDSGEAGGFLYYVMPYIAGENLRDRIQREGQLGVDEAVRIARNVREALDYAHRNDVIHRDIKTANISLHDGNPLVADFGIALAVSAAGGGRLTETGLSLGTPHYMSPEQAGADRDLSARSDVYSLGCVVTVSLDGSVAEETLDPRRIESLAWSPDGRYVAYAGREPGECAPGDPWILDLPGQGSADTAVARPVLESEDENRGMSVDPRGDLVTYASNATGEWEVYVRTFPAPGPPVMISEGGGSEPHWSADGNSIYYFRSGDGSTHLWEARIDRGPPVAVVGLDSLMAWPGRAGTSGDLHPDGDRFITTRSGEAADESDGDEAGADDVRYFVVTNWFEEMRARLGGGG